MKTELRNRVALEAACARLQLKAPHEGTHRMYSGTHTGLGVELPGWKYPVVVQPETGEIKFDNFSGTWGKMTELDKLVQGYTLEAAKPAAAMQGYSCSEEELADGSIQLTMVNYAEG